MATNFSFGAPTTAPPAFGSTTLSFGGSTNQPAGLSFGTSPAPAAQATPSLFGAPAAAPAQAPPSLFGSAAPATGLFGAAPAAAPTLSFNPTNPPAFGVATTSTGFGIGAPTSSAAPALAYATVPGLGTSITTTAPPPTFELSLPTSAAPAPTSAAPNLSFGFGGLGGATSTSIGLTSTTQASVAGVGLGGINSFAPAKNAVTTQKEIPPKGQTLPNEILQTVEEFKNTLKYQKLCSSDIARCSTRDYRKNEQGIDLLISQLNDIEKQLQKDKLATEKLKYHTANIARFVEIAQMTHDTPPGLQYDNTAPIEVFLNFTDQFEKDMQNIKSQIEAVDRYVRNHKNPDSLTPQDLSEGMKRLQDAFVALAGQLHAVHSQVESQKEIYLNMRKHVLQDTSNPFDKIGTAKMFYDAQNAFTHSLPKIATGPTPFNNMALQAVTLGVSPQPQNNPPPAYPGTSSNATTGFGVSGFGPLGATQHSNATLFGTSNVGQPPSFGQSFYNSSFQLQKPPSGNKRGKM
ncbi:unnamed protein product [Ceutorhynchus assimilis]|uniref:Nucleoporin p58/p45 n=1 Tax=Ceutorhynchus assimilis TaxID=467358 RepID=A0A9N9MI11_9CUCU|nr:unnamed protein product [Ceutorhynchus assimilis]